MALTLCELTARAKSKSGEIDGRVRPLTASQFQTHTVYFKPVHGHKVKAEIRSCIFPVLDGSCCLRKGNEPQSLRVSAEQRPQTAAKLE